MRLGQQDGISLLEVLAGITLFAVVSVGLATTTISTIQANTASREMTTAAALIHDKMEDIRALDVSANPADLTAGTHQDPANPLTPLGAAGGTFTRSWVVTSNSPSLNISRVEVTVSFKTPEPRTMTGVTYVCRRRTCN